MAYARTGTDQLQAQAATVRHLRQKVAVRAALRENGAPLVSMFELRAALEACSRKKQVESQPVFQRFFLLNVIH